jgi:endonuclease III
MRKELIAWIVANLMPQRKLKLFKRAVKEYTRKGIENHKEKLHKALSAQSKLTNYYGPKKGITETPKASTTKDKATEAKDKAAKATPKANTTKDKATTTKDKATEAKDKATTTKDKATEAKDKAAKAKQATTATTDKAKAKAKDTTTPNKQQATADKAKATKATKSVVADKKRKHESQDTLDNKKKMKGTVLAETSILTKNASLLKMKDDIDIKDYALFRDEMEAQKHFGSLQIQIETNQDKQLGLLLRAWKNFLLNSGDVNRAQAHWKYAIALSGSTRQSLRELWISYKVPQQYMESISDELDAPERVKKGSVEYLKPHIHFKSMAQSAMQVMRVLMDACYLNGIEIIRYYWEYHLMKGINQLEEKDKNDEEQFDPQKRLRAMLACLILSAATTDFGAIDGAIKLGQAGLFDDIDAMCDSVNQKVILRCINGCGIHIKRARYLQNAFTMIKTKHGGLVPHRRADLELLPGVGPKTANLMLNEAFGFFAGIGTDKHVCHVSLGLGLFAKTHGLKNAAPDHVEASLRTWIPQCDFKDTNKIFGGMAQLVTQMLASISKDKSEQVHILFQCMLDRFNDHELETVWFMIKCLREHYEVVEKKRRKLDLENEDSNEESGDEAYEEESEESNEEMQE